MLALLHYSMGMPFYRLAQLQRHLQTPVPESTQWDLLNKHVPLLQPVYDLLLHLAAQGDLLHSDDSYVRILEFMGKRRADLLAKGKLENPDRTGLFTTAIVGLDHRFGHFALS